MKITVTLLAFACSSVVSFAQNGGRTPVDTQERSENDPVIIRDTKGNTTASEAVAIITAVRSGLNTRTTTTAGTTPAFTEAEYKTLLVNADNFMLQRKYADAILLYNEVLENRSDQYAKDRILEANALQAKQQKEEEQLKRDEVLRAKAELASSDTYGKHAVHFTGALMSDVCSTDRWTTEAFNKNDPYSNFLKPGKYDNLSKDLKKATDFTLDGIAVPANTRLVVYKNQDCTGEVLLDVTGPAIVNNGYRVSNKRFKNLSSKQFHPALQSYFPQETRSWSTTNMHDWISGSMEIIMLTEE